MRNNQPITQRERTFPAQQRLISTTNAKGVVTYCNDAFIEISGFTREELTGAPHNLVRHPDVPPAVFAHMWQTLKQGQPWMGIVKNRCKSGDHYWVNAYVTPIFDNNQVVGFESVRVKPTAEQIRRAEALYQRINQGKPPVPRRDKWLPVLQDWLPFILISQVGFLIGNWLGHSWGFALAAGLSVPLGLLGLSWQQRGLKRLLRLAEQTTSDPLIAQMYTDSRGVQARLEMAMLSQDARMKTCLTRLQDSAEHLSDQARQSDALAHKSSSGLERQRVETEQVAAAVNQMAATTQEVANHVQRTAESTGQIHGLIAKLQQTASNAVLTMETGHRQAQEGVDRVMQADEALVGISEAVANITDMATQIAAATEEQTAVADEISRNISTIAELADQTAEQAQHSALLSEELTSTAGSQYSLVERFNR
ncbi:methyl-accepting chemotaxis protein [Pseudomonas sp. DCA-1]|uniref:methyl-accepting chemotaxis protein n=1 Tax=Pseudomonas sp. DCA-1 TaxID=3344874 RepID=UPI00397728C1